MNNLRLFDTVARSIISEIVYSLDETYSMFNAGRYFGELTFMIYSDKNNLMNLLYLKNSILY